MDEETIGINDGDGLKISLYWHNLQTREADRELAEMHAASESLGRKIDALVGRTDAVLRELEIENISSGVPNAVEQTWLQNLRLVSKPKTYDQAIAEVRAQLERRGIDTKAITWEEILGGPQYEQVHRRFSVGFRLEADLDAYDLLMVGIAALTGVLVDWLLVNVPPQAGLLGRKATPGGLLSRWLKSFEVSDDNWLAKRLKVAYDANIPGTDVGGHRLYSVGHDPLIGIIVGVFDIMRGGMTYVDAQGVIRSSAGTGPPIDDPLVAVIYHLAHLLSDVFTRRGLPAPGWEFLLTLQSIPTPFQDRNVAQIAKDMYRYGYDFRHFLAMGTVPAAIEVALHIYFAVRCYCDSEFNGNIDRQIALAAGTRRSDSEKYLTMSLLANAGTAALNGVRVWQQGPLGFNYPQWLNFARRLAKWLNRRLNEPSEILLRGIQANSRALLENWPIPQSDRELESIGQELCPTGSRSG